jgi:organic radical activating enzyme
VNLASIQFPVFKPYGVSTVEIYIAGCNRKTCSGDCHNEEIRSFICGKPLILKDLIAYLEERRDLFECISITGGDLLCQPEVEIFLLIQEIRIFFPDKIKWLFTGEDDFKKIPEFCKIVFDVIKYGAYREELKQEGFPSSSNQSVWKRTKIGV